MRQHTPSSFVLGLMMYKSAWDLMLKMEVICTGDIVLPIFIILVYVLEASVICHKDPLSGQ